MVLFLIGILILRIFSPWFSSVPISAGDWPYLFVENIKEFSWFPEIRFLWLAPWYQIVTKIVVQYFGIPWVITEKLFWFLPFIIVSLISSYKLTKSALGPLIYTTNTYTLMIVGGGQLGVTLSYALAPLVLKFLIETKKIVFGCLVFAVQVMFDPRIAVLTMIAALVYHMFTGTISRKLIFIGICIGTATLFNLYWIFPLLSSRAPIAQQFREATVDSVKFLSFASFEQTLSLLHPNWPENVFGKIHFMQPEFLFLPIIAFSSLLIAEKSRRSLYFSFLALLGAFLAKGANPPFGEAYLWLFNRVPGFILFRDPSKFYLYPAIAFSVLIPFTIQRAGKTKLFSLLFVLFWSFTIREALLGQLTGTFRPMEVPQEYIKLKDFFNSQQEAFQTLWIPQRQRFGFSSKSHFGIDAQIASKQSSISGTLQWMMNEETQKDLAAAHVKYVIVPYDSRHELFLADRKYNEDLYRDTLNQLAGISWLHKLDSFSRIGVFEIR